MKRKILSLILVFAMTVSLLTVGTGAVEPTYGDTAGHWAESSIDRWSGHGIIQGSNGEFDPNGQLTCAQLATILARLLKLPAAPSAGFSDVAANAWYADAINRCVAAGILNGNGDGTVDPNGAISRERAMVMLGRALGIQPIENPDLSKHSDAAKVSDYAQGIVAAMIEAGIVTGVGGDQIAPKDNINRASTVTILDRAISAYADQAGETIKGDGKGIILVVAENVTITGDVDTLLVVAPDATVTLDGANAKNVSVNGEDSKLVLNNSEVENVSVSGANTEVETKGSSKVDNVSVTEDAKGSTVNAGSGTTIGTVDSKADNVSISGDGKVDNASVSGDNTKVDTKDTKVDVAEGVTGTTAGGKDVAGGTTAETPATPSTPSGGGSSSGGSSGSTHTHDYKTETVTKEPTCTEKGEKKLTCSCGASKTEEIPALGHDWDDGVITKEATCTETGEKTVTCKRTGCDASETQEIPAAGHTEVIDAAAAATCAEAGKTEGKHCSVCNEVLVAQTTIPAKGHSFSDEWTSDETSHWHAASCGHSVKQDVAEHEWGEWTVISATETEDGSKTRVCAVCEREETVILTRTGHDLTKHEAKAATCTEDGNPLYWSCGVCSKNFSDENGLYELGADTQLVYGKLGHTEVAIPAVEATCTETGLTAGKKCSVCSEILVAQEETPKKEHTRDEKGMCIFCYDGATAQVGSNYYSTLADAVKAAQDSDTVTLLKNTTERNIWLKKNITVDLGGHTLTAQTDSYGFCAASGVQATLKNGTITNAYCGLAVWGAESDDTRTNVTVDQDVTISDSYFGVILAGFSSKNDFTGKTGFATLNYNGKIDMEKEDQCAIFVMGNLGNDEASAAKIGEEGNLINIGATANIYSEHEEAIILNGMAKLTVVDGALIKGADAITMKRGYLNITGGTLEATGDKYIPVEAEHSGAERSGSAVTVTSTYNNFGQIDVTISGGTFTSENSYGFYAGLSVEDGSQIAFKNANFAISGGSFTGSEGGAYFATGKHITGGTFSSDPGAYVAEGYGVKSEDGVYTITEPVAEINGKKYATLVAAINAAESGQTVTLLRDASGAGLSSLDKGQTGGQQTRESLTIDFGGFTYTMENPAVGSKGTETQAMHWGTSLGAVTMRNGTFKVAENADQAKMAMQNYITFTAEDMVFDFRNIPVTYYGENEFKDTWAAFNGREISMFNNNGSDTKMTLIRSHVDLPDDSNFGGAISGTLYLNDNSSFGGPLCFNDTDGTIIVDDTSKIAGDVVKAYFDDLSVTENPKGTWTATRTSTGE